MNDTLPEIPAALGQNGLGQFVRDLERQAPLQITKRPDFSALSEQDVEAGLEAWTVRMIDEFRSVIVFSELFGLLAQTGAPFEVLCAVQRLIGDELRHTRLCYSVASWFGEVQVPSLDADDLAVPPTPDPPAGRALEIVVRELEVAEAESVIALRAYRAATTDPAVHQAMTVLLRDEVGHAVLGKRLARLLPKVLSAQDTASVRARLPAETERDRRHIRETHRRGAIGGAGRAVGASLEMWEIPPLEEAAVG